MKSIICENYKVFIGENILRNVQLDSYKKICLLTDKNQKNNIIDYFLKEIKSEFDIIEIESSEINKNISSVLNIWNFLSQNNYNKNSLIINLGGGVICDLGGFCASTFKRGIDFLNIPTTLLSMVDASIGGKNGINFHGFKNQIGTFKNPISVYIDTNFLNTLETNQWLSGYVEIVKSALIYDSDFWTLLSSKFYKDHNINELIFKSLNIKKEIVEKDPFDKGPRKILNFGHTIGHAIESFYLNKKKKITHGKAIAMGIVMELKYSRTRKKNEIIKYIKSIYNEIEEVDINHLIKYLKHDKKNEDNLINFSILKDIGKCDFNNYINIDDL